MFSGLEQSLTVIVRGIATMSVVVVMFSRSSFLLVVSMPDVLPILKYSDHWEAEELNKIAQFRIELIAE